MNMARPVAAVAVAAAVAAGTSSQRASAADPSQCMSYSPLGFCIEWSTPGTDNPGSTGSSGGGEGPPCYWVTIDYDPSIDDGPIFADYGIEPPPEGVEVVWQVMECSDGSAIDDFRWIIPPNPREIAEGVRGRIAGTLPEPLVASSPAAGVAAIVGVPVFVQVTNWTGIVTAQECAGFCVTVRAVPSLTFNPGETGASGVACAEVRNGVRAGWPAADRSGRRRRRLLLHVRAPDWCYRPPGDVAGIGVGDVDDHVDGDDRREQGPSRR